jgi:hypothetical protein
MKKVLGFTDEKTVCECCGKSGLKGTYAVEVDGMLTYFGSTCAFKKHGVAKEDMKKADSLYSTLKFHGVKTIEEYNAKQRRMCESANEWRASKGIPLITEEEIQRYFIKKAA